MPKACEQWCHKQLGNQTSKSEGATCALELGCMPDRELMSPKEPSAKGSCEVSGVMPPSGCRLSPSLCKGVGDSRASLADQLRPNTWARRSFWLTCCSKPTTGGPASTTTCVKVWASSLDDQARLCSTVLLGTYLVCTCVVSNKEGSW